MEWSGGFAQKSKLVRENNSLSITPALSLSLPPSLILSLSPSRFFIFCFSHPPFSLSLSEIRWRVERCKLVNVFEHGTCIHCTLISNADATMPQSMTAVPSSALRMIIQIKNWNVKSLLYANQFAFIHSFNPSPHFGSCDSTWDTVSIVCTDIACFISACPQHGRSTMILNKISKS